MPILQMRSLRLGQLAQAAQLGRQDWNLALSGSRSQPLNCSAMHASPLLPALLTPNDPQLLLPGPREAHSLLCPIQVGEIWSKGRSFLTRLVVREEEE